MTKNKFDEQDREKVVSQLEQHHKIKLQKIGNRTKHYRTDSGKRFWILGGYGHWHGIPPEMMDMEIRQCENTVLVLAVRKKSKVEVYSGRLGILVLERHRLSKGKNGTYHFNVNEYNGFLSIREIAGAHFSSIFTIPYSIEQKVADWESYSRMRDIKRIFSKMTLREKRNILARLDCEKPYTAANDNAAF